MKIRVLILLVLAMAYLPSAGQRSDLLKRLENGNLQMRQRLGTDSLLAKYLSCANPKIAEDTIYALIYRPGGCPRCEYSIRYLKKLLNKRGKKLTLISVHEDANASWFYNKKKKYYADYYLYDTSRGYDKFFSFNNYSLDGAFLFKATLQGRLITATDNSFIDDSFAQALVDCDIPFDYMSFEPKGYNDVVAKAYDIYSSLDVLSDKYHDTKLSMPDSVHLCNTLMMPTYADSLFFYPDMLLGGAMTFGQDGDGDMQFKQLLMPTQKERMQHILIDSATYTTANRMGMFFDIICNVNYLDNHTLGMTFSLPSLYYEPDSSIAYLNAACMLERNADDFSVGKTTDFDFQLGKSDYFFKHFQFSSTGDNIILYCTKDTWPGSRKKAEYMGNVDMDPFMPAFYATYNPFMAVFSRRSGKLVKTFGNLSDISRTCRTGYAFVDPMSTVSGGELAYTDGASGYVYVSDTASIGVEKARYEVFDFDGITIPPSDSTKFYTFEYKKPYYHVFFRKVADVRLTSEQVHSIVEYQTSANGGLGKSLYSYVVVDRESGKRHEWAFPEHPDCYVFARGLHTIGCDRVMPFEVLKKGSRAWLRVYDIPR